MARLFAEAPQAVEETIRFLDGLAFSLDELAHDYPQELREGFADAAGRARSLRRGGRARALSRRRSRQCAQGARARTRPDRASSNYAPYFLTVHDIVRYAALARHPLPGARLGGQFDGLLLPRDHRGRSRATSICCSSVSSRAERNEPPDIDVDFEHERREEVIQYIYQRYGRERAGLAAAVTTYRTRSAIRETAKVFGLSEDVIVALDNTIWGHGSGPIDEERAQAAGLDPADPSLGAGARAGRAN